MIIDPSHPNETKLLTLLSDEFKQLLAPARKPETFPFSILPSPFSRS